MENIGHILIENKQNNNNNNKTFLGGSFFCFQYYF